MRILMLNNEFPPLGGGQGVVNARLLEEFSSVPDLSIDLITANLSKADWEIRRVTDRITTYFLPVGNKDIHHSTVKELLLYGWRAYGVARKLMNEGARYDLSFAFSAIPAGIVSWRLFKSHGIPFLVRSPGVDIPGFEERYRPVYPILAPLVREIWRCSRGYIVSSSFHEELAKRHDPTVLTNVIVNAVDCERFSPRVRDSSREKTIILCVARLVRRKGVADLLRALAAVFEASPSLRASTELVLAGTGDDEGSLKELAASLGISSNVRFLGFVDRDQLPALYRSADLFTLPSHNEGMSNAALEALASGLPLLLTAVGGTAEIVEHGVNGLVVPPGDIAILASALRDLLCDSGRLAEMGAESRVRAALFDWHAVTKQYLELIRRAVA